MYGISGCGCARMSSTSLASSSRPQSSRGPVPLIKGTPVLRKLRAIREATVSRSQATGQEGAVLISETTSASTVPKSKVWELDFCSR